MAGGRRGESRNASGVFMYDLLLYGGKCRASRETQTVYGMVLGATGVSLAGSHRSSLPQNSLLRCLAARCCHREEAFLTYLQSDLLTRRCQKLRSVMSALHLGMVGRNPSSMSVLQWKEAIMRKGVKKASLLSDCAI